MVSPLRAMTWPERLLVLGFGIGAGVAVGAVLFEWIDVGHYWQTDGKREGFEVEAFGYTIQRSEDRGGTGVTTAELVWHCLAVVAPLAGAVAAALATIAALSACARPQPEQAPDYDDQHAAEPPFVLNHLNKCSDP